MLAAAETGVAGACDHQAAWLGETLRLLFAQTVLWDLFVN